MALTATVAAAGTWQYSRLGAPAPAQLTVETSTPGLDVSIDGKPAGRTPISVTLQPGEYGVAVGTGTQRREMRVALAPGASVFRHLDMKPEESSTITAASDQSARLRIETTPASMSVMVDGVDRGVSPVTVAALSAGAHDVVVRGAGAQFRHTIALRGGETTVLVFGQAVRPDPPAVAAGAAGGWLAVTSFIPVQIRDAGKVVGSTESERIMLPAGEHALEFVNESLGYQARRSVRIEGGKTTALTLEGVNGRLSINAQPWAEVWVDGERVGQTPIGNLSRRIGTHEVVLRHPEFGERRERVTVTARGPARLGVDMRRKP